MRAEARRFKEEHLLPKKMQNKPSLFFGNALFLNAWFDLDQERDRPKRISRSMCFQYAVDYEFDSDQTEDLWFFVQRMENEFLPWWVKKHPPKARGGRGKDA